jgi:type I restriction enzyme S subunit
MSFPRYPAYKDSGMEWLGEVPEHWSILSLKRRYAIQGGSTPKTDRQEFWDGDIAWITPADLSSLSDRFIRFSQRSLTPEGVSSCATTIVPPGSVILSTRAPIGSLGIADQPLCTNQGCKSLVPNENQHSPFLAYVLDIATDELNVRGRGTTFLELSSDALSAFEVPFPSAVEQSSIANFLDRETAKIDALVADYRTLIELLQEKRQAVISHAVTKGLDPTVPMKDSGVEWLGEVPEHWRVVRLKFVATVQTGVAKGKDNSDKAVTEVPYLRVANVQDGYLDLADIATIEIPQDDLERYALRPGDVLMNEGGDYDKLGRGHVWDGEIAPCIHQNHVFAVRPTGVSSAWLNRITGSIYAQFYFMARSKQSTIVPCTMDYTKCKRR